MNTIAWYIITSIVFIGWIGCIVSWIRRGCPIPRWLHIFAGCLFVAGVITMIVLGARDHFSLKLVLSCLIVPPGVAYIGWLWMWGPTEREGRK